MGPLRSHAVHPSGKEGSLVSPLTRPAQDLNWLVTNFVERVPSVAHAIVVSSDGLPMAFSQGFPPERVDHLAAVTSGLTSLTQGASRVFEGGAVLRRSWRCSAGC
jgi:predicted regulator of Ras-like GTPase activity (Roadblock/LC7/MglB family)